MTGIFVETLAPPRMAVSGRVGESTAALMYCSSFSMRKPPAAGPSMFPTTPAVDAWARCAVPNASFTYASAPEDPANAAAKNESFLVSPAWNRTFSRRTTPPAGAAAQALATSSPMQSSVWTTSTSRSSEKRPTMGATEKAGSGRPLGRPMCVATTTRAPASVRYFIVGTTARRRVSSVIVVPTGITEFFPTAATSARSAVRNENTGSGRRARAVLLGQRHVQVQPDQHARRREVHLRAPPSIKASALSSKSATLA